MLKTPVKILITGANGQLGGCLKALSAAYPEFQFVFTSKSDLNITDSSALTSFFKENKISHCVNAAAYTNVEAAEKESEKAFLVNAESVKNLAMICNQNQVVLYHVSTDYVFDGEKTTPYLEEDVTNPINVYGASKLKGEQYIQEICDKYFIFRTSWLYSQYGHNFFKTILRLASEGKPMTITTEQTGTPTNANDLARIILELIRQDNQTFGVYHFSNAGATTWYGFAKAILESIPKYDNVKLAKTDYYRTFAKRPKYSVLDNTKAKKALNTNQKNWQKSLLSVIEKIN